VGSTLHTEINTCDNLLCPWRPQVIYWDCLESRALPQFVREQLIRLHRVTGQCLYAACDIVIPCNATFNTKWEVGTLQKYHRKLHWSSTHRPCINHSYA
jgi:hypothetical protein